MTPSASPFPSKILTRLAAESARRSSSLHSQFLEQRVGSLQGLKTLIELQIRAAGSIPATRLPAIFTSQQLDAFGTGKISDCFGPAFARYDHRRVARIPNGDLKMMSQVVAVTGQRGNFTAPAEIEVEYDVPDSAWYLTDNAGVDLPFSLVMETALQPCGFLMAYLDTYAALPEGLYNFRNLDGWIHMQRRFPASGCRLLTHARLLSSVLSGGVLIQKFAFDLSSNGQPFCQGETSFGYFPQESMSSQVGLDGGKKMLPWIHQNGKQAGSWINLARWMQPDPLRPRYRLSRGRLNLVDRVYVEREGGRYGHGYVFAERDLNPQDWFYPFHFYQDPVMPGSLGVEAILQAAQVFALESGLGEGLRVPYFGLAERLQTQWRYRGQIVQAHHKMQLELHVQQIEQSAVGLALSGDASLWADGLRIYEVKNAGIGILEG